MGRLIPQPLFRKNLSISAACPFSNPLLGPQGPSCCRAQMRAGYSSGARECHSKYQRLDKALVRILTRFVIRRAPVAPLRLASRLALSGPARGNNGPLSDGQALAAKRWEWAAYCKAVAARRCLWVQPGPSRISHYCGWLIFCSAGQPPKCWPHRLWWRPGLEAASTEMRLDEQSSLVVVVRMSRR